LKELPDDIVRHSPVLSVFYGSMLMFSGDRDAVEPRLDDAERALAGVGEGSPLPWADTDDLRALPATIATYRAALAQATGDAAGTARHARRALDLAGAEDHLARGGAAGFLGLAAWAQGDVTSALAIFTQAVASLHAAGNLVDELSGTVLLGDLWLAAGRPSKARQLCAQALGVAEAHGAGVARATAELHVGLSEMDVEVGDLESAKRHLDTAAALASGAAMTESRFRWFVARALLARADGDSDEAVHLLDQAQQLYRPGFLPDVRPIAAIKARIWIAQGKLSEAADWARERGLPAPDDPRYLGEYDHLTYVRLLLAQHRAHQDTRALEQASSLLDRLHAAAGTAARAGSLLEIRLLQALVQDAQGRQRQALETLAQAFAMAPEPESYARLFLNEGAPMMSLLREAKLSGVGADHVRRLLHLGASAEAPAGFEPRVAQPAADALSDRELQVLRLLAGELTGPEIARALFVSHNTLRTHTKHIFTKLDVTSRRAAIVRARERGLL
ncbi:MAG TPA: LuxR C-terminal-related transcriptional regulator, partial [Propionibacteriaceae bacterium]